MSFTPTKELVNNNWVIGRIDAASTSSFAYLYGTGVDGDATITGTTTLTKETYYNNLTVNSGAVLKPNGWRIHVRNTCTINSGGSINDNGNNGAGAVPGAALGARNYLVCAAGGGGSGSLGANSGSAGGGSGGNAQPNDSNAAPAGGRGAFVTSFVGGNAGGSAVQSPQTSIRSPFNLIAGRSFVAGYNGGGGGGGGASQLAGDVGGGGGSGGGGVWISAKILINNGIISANGGDGAAGVAGSGTGSAGGGGGGGGGWVGVICGPSSITGTITANAGNAGISAGAGITSGSQQGIVGTTVVYVVQ